MRFVPVLGFAVALLSRCCRGSTRIPLLGALALAVCLGCSGSQTLAPVIKTDTVAMLTPAQATGAIVFADKLRWKNAGNADLMSLTPGKVIPSDVGGGFLRRIMSAPVDDGTWITVETEDAVLTDIIEQGETETTVDLATMAMQQMGTQSVRPSSITPSVSGGALTLDIADETIAGSSDLGVTVRIKQGQLRFAPSLDVGIKISGTDGRQAHAIVNGALSGDLEIEAVCTQMLQPQTLNHRIYIVKDAQVAGLAIGNIGIPVLLSFFVDMGVVVDGTGSVTITVGAAASANAQLGFTYDSSGWHDVNTFNTTWTRTGPDADMTNFTLHVQPYLQADLQLRTFAGSSVVAQGTIDVTLKPYLDFTLDPQATPAWTLLGGFRSDLTASLETLFGFGPSWQHQANLYANTWPIADATTDGMPGALPPDTDIGTGNDGDLCVSNTDCKSNQCMSGACVSTSAVGAGMPCMSDGDCQSGTCNVDPQTQQMVCQPPIQCTDGIQDGQETDIDCGGPICAQCSATQKCAADTDCNTGKCLQNLCASAPINCTDGVQDGDETGVDCGGSCLIPCPGGMTCSDPTPDFCSGQCVDITSDASNCGDCGNICGDGMQCVQGACDGG